MDSDCRSQVNKWLLLFSCWRRKIRPKCPSHDTQWSLSRPDWDGGEEEVAPIELTLLSLTFPLFFLSSLGSDTDRERVAVVVKEPRVRSRVVFSSRGGFAVLLLSLLTFYPSIFAGCLSGLNYVVLNELLMLLNEGKCLSSCP